VPTFPAQTQPIEITVGKLHVLKKTPPVYSKLYYKEYEIVKLLQALKYKIRVFLKVNTECKHKTVTTFYLQPKQHFRSLRNFPSMSEIQFDARCEIFSCP
jgi:hypothetical protein